MRGAIPRFEEGADNERLHPVLPSAADSRLQTRLTSVQALAIKDLEGRGIHAKVVEDESWWFGSAGQNVEFPALTILRFSCIIDRTVPIHSTARDPLPVSLD